VYFATSIAYRLYVNGEYTSLPQIRQREPLNQAERAFKPDIETLNQAEIDLNPGREYRPLTFILCL
jgi:hypothetical protein